MKTLVGIQCPFCHSNQIMRLEYGVPDTAMIQKIEEGLILHGGCAIEGLMEPYYCINCDQRFTDDTKK